MAKLSPLTVATTTIKGRS